MRSGSNLRNDEVLAALRLATSERHREIDLAMPLSRPNPTMADYIEHLRLVRAWLHPQTRWVDGAQLQTTLIDADLAEAGFPADPESAIAGVDHRPAHASAAYQWGARYVIEGSRLGAAVLYRRLAPALHPHKLRYLQGSSETSGNRWPQFLNQLRAGVQAPADIEEACAGACDSFDALLTLHPAH